MAKTWWVYPEWIDSHNKRDKIEVMMVSDHQSALAEQDQKLEELRADLYTAESALVRKGYRKECDIPACNCGPQWNHHGHAEERLREISDAVPYINGKTILQRVEQLQADLDQVVGEAENVLLRILASLDDATPKLDVYHAFCTAWRARWEVADLQWKEGKG